MIALYNLNVIFIKFGYIISKLDQPNLNLMILTDLIKIYFLIYMTPILSLLGQFNLNIYPLIIIVRCQTNRTNWPLESLFGKSFPVPARLRRRYPHNSQIWLSWSRPSRTL
jgi:hypothetical protein